MNTKVGAPCLAGLGGVFRFTRIFAHFLQRNRNLSTGFHQGYFEEHIATRNNDILRRMTEINLDKKRTVAYLFKGCEDREKMGDR